MTMMMKFLENLKCWLLVAAMMCGLGAAAQTEDEVYGVKLMTYLKTYDGHKTELKSFGKILSKRGLEGEAAKVWIDKYVGEQFEKDMKELYVPFYKDIVTAEELDTLTQLYSSEEFKILEQKLEENIQSVAEKFKDSDVLKTYSKEAISCLLENKPCKPLPPVECSESYRVKCDTLVSDVSQILAAGTLMATMFSWELVSGEQKEKITDEQWAGFTVYLVDVWKNVLLQFFVEIFTEHDLDIMIEVQRAPVSVRFSAKMLESLSGAMKISRQLDERFEAWLDTQEIDYYTSSSNETK